MTWSSPHLSASGENADAPRRAPAFPQAALIPFRVDRHVGEYVTLGSANVVVLGP
eukprot:CAMPEP_0183324768 /NCGR_PEP_ID=MMETSP0160_2-20130417/77884_1 /TAXON_ID=2839 ORGANISM="Odontella Sinensis, Strain Grunow 1884" /NCGR_SAMPLE_ID=MMETSP0160_2 /ASSEMBLY_ACC=CAM_ASM_000250 /LENGTH=54 /DNA_ID=CAMNT_0025492417 /DNA_START=121 /DNA_END=285 /DNA_ORIENTATION=-